MSFSRSKTVCMHNKELVQLAIFSWGTRNPFEISTCGLAAKTAAYLSLAHNDFK